MSHILPPSDPSSLCLRVVMVGSGQEGSAEEHWKLRGEYLVQPFYKGCSSRVQTRGKTAAVVLELERILPWMIRVFLIRTLHSSPANGAAAVNFSM